jgi:SAM-dependent methyltransferase
VDDAERTDAGTMTRTDGWGPGAPAREPEDRDAGPGADPGPTEDAEEYADPAEYVVRRPAGNPETVRANRTWWDENADAYQSDHGDFLGDARFLWCPEGLYEDQARLLGDVRGRRVLEVGCGAAQCSRWLLAEGALAVGFDLSARQLAHARRIDEALGGPRPPLVQADATRIPFADGVFDTACSAFGAVPFVEDSSAVMREVARVLRPGGRWVFAVPHPVRWCLPDAPGEEGLTVRDSYFDRRPYVEQDETGAAVYVEHHRTFGDRIRELAAAGFAVLDVVEPEYPESLGDRWGGGWSGLRGRLVPGTAVFVAVKPA